MIFIFFFSVSVSLLFLAFFRNVGPWQHRSVAPDYLYFYKPIAQSILEGKGFIIKGNYIVSPGYPIFLAIIFEIARFIKISELQLILFFNVIITGVGCIFIFLIGELIFKKRIALIASLLWASYPFNLWFIKNPNTEIPFIPCLYMGVWLSILALEKKRIKFLFLAGLAFGIASLIRPVNVFLPLFLALAVFFILKRNPLKTRFLFATILLIGYLAIIVPWQIYIASQVNYFLILQGGGPSTVKDGIAFALRVGEGGDRVAVPEDVGLLMQKAREADLNSEWKIALFIIKQIQERPVAFLKLILIKMARAWYATSEMWWEQKILIVQFLYLIPALIGLFLAFKFFKDRTCYIIFILSIVFYFFLMTVVALSILRYMVPVMGLIIIFSAVLIELIITNLLKKLSPKTS